MSGKRRPELFARDAGIVADWRSGITLRSLAATHHLTRARIGQILWAAGDSPAGLRREKSECRAREAREKALANSRPCAICGAPVLSRRAKNCSSQCRDDSKTLRFLLRPEAHQTHREDQARCDAQAGRPVTDPTKPPNRRYVYSPRVMAALRRMANPPKVEFIREPTTCPTCGHTSSGTLRLLEEQP